MDVQQHEDFIRARITELRIKQNVSEHKMSLDLDKSGSYIRNITNGLSLPSIKELMNIIAYFHMTPAEFFAPTAQNDTEYAKLCERLRNLSEAQLRKVNMFLDMIE